MIAYLRQATPEKFNKAFAGIIKAKSESGNPILDKAEVDELLKQFGLSIDDLA